MRMRRGQSTVEFALIAPMLFLMVFGMIWGAFMFIEYMHFSNQVRTVARQIAVTDPDERNHSLLTTYEQSLKDFYDDYNMPKMYHPQIFLDYMDENGNRIDDGKEKGDVTVVVFLVMNDEDYNSLPNILKLVEFPPRSIKTIEYRMKLEGTGTSITDTENNNNENNDTNENQQTT